MKEKNLADIWLKDHLEELVDKFAGGYVVIVGRKGVVFTDADGKPRELIKRAKAKFPGIAPLFFRVPHHQDFTCALTLL